MKLSHTSGHMNEPAAVKDASVEQRVNLRHFRERTYLTDERAPYHGVSHPDKVWEKALILINRCEKYGIAVNGDDLRNAIELHDALAHLPARMLGFNSAEELAAKVAFHFLQGCGYTEAAASRISNIVMATNPDVRPVTREEIIMRAADLWNIGSSYPEFKEASHALHQEAINSAGRDIPFTCWARGAFLHLQRFLWPMLELTPEAKDEVGRSTWHTNAICNLTSLWRETYGKDKPIVAEFFPRGEIQPRMLTPKEFYIALHPDEDARDASMEKIHKEALIYDGAAFALPAAIGVFPIPNETCSTFISHDPSPESLHEALRVTRKGGTIIVDAPEHMDPRVLEIAQAFPCTTVDRLVENTCVKTLMIQKELVL